jgi:hypothetical protein
MKRGPLLLVGLLGFLVLAGGAYAVRARRGTSIVSVKHPGSPIADSLRAPAGIRIKVEVINTTKKSGYGRRASQLLRDRGFDVVDVGSGGPARDTTLVLDRSGHGAWAATVAKILGTSARTESRPDSSRYLDVTVLLGTAWRPPSEPLNP